MEINVITLSEADPLLLTISEKIFTVISLYLSIFQACGPKYDSVSSTMEDVENRQLSFKVHTHSISLDQLRFI